MDFFFFLLQYLPSQVALYLVVGPVEFRSTTKFRGTSNHFKSVLESSTGINTKS